MVMKFDIVDGAKKAVAIEAAQMAPSGGIIGLGTGSTASYVIEELGRRMRDEGAHFTSLSQIRVGRAIENNAAQRLGHKYTFLKTENAAISASRQDAADWVCASQILSGNEEAI